jgi:hypothetical protein
MIDDEDFPVATRIKHLVFAINDALKELVDLAQTAKDDEEICKGINQFKGEVLFNFLARFKDIDNQMEVVMGPFRSPIIAGHAKRTASGKKSVSTPHVPCGTM